MANYAKTDIPLGCVRTKKDLMSVLKINQTTMARLLAENTFQPEVKMDNGDIFYDAVYSVRYIMSNPKFYNSRKWRDELAQKKFQSEDDEEKLRSKKLKAEAELKDKQAKREKLRYDIEIEKVVSIKERTEQELERFHIIKRRIYERNREGATALVGIGTPFEVTKILDEITDEAYLKIQDDFNNINRGVAMDATVEVEEDDAESEDT